MDRDGTGSGRSWSGSVGHDISLMYIWQKVGGRVVGLELV